MNNSYLILFLSQYSDKSAESSIITYHDENGRPYEGVQTNDAPTKCLISEALNNQEPVSKILCITSKKVYFSMAKDGKTAFELYQEMVTEYCNKISCEVPEIIPIHYEVKDGEGVDVQEQPMYIYRQIVEEFKKNKEDIHAYVDYTGGVRDISFLMTVIIRYLEFNRISCSKVVYSNYYNKRIYDILYIYDMFQMINGASEFVETGSAKQLKKLADRKLGKEAKDLIESIVRFSDTISLCSVGDIDAAVKGIAESLQQIEDRKETDDIFVEMLRTLVPIIKRKMYVEEDAITYPRLVQWCAENGLLQQAITIYIEKMPVYYVENGLLPDNIEGNEADSSLSSSKEAAAFYEGLFGKYYPKSDMEKLHDVIECVLRKKDIIEKEAMEELKKVLPDEKWPKVYDRLDAVYKCYQKGGARAVIYGEEIVQGSFKKFLNQLKSNEQKYMHYLLYDNPKKYKEYENDKKDEEKSERKAGNTYKKKVAALNLLKEEGTEQEKKVLFPKMKYYLALKLVRNRMNHASEQEMNKGERMAIDWLGENGIVINTDYVNIKEIIMRGIEAGLKLE